MINNNSTHSCLKSNHSAFSIFLIFLRLGLTSFGGPVAHIAYFRDEFVARKKWFTDQSYTEIVALCQFLPGPASSQIGLAIGLSSAGYRGALAAWMGFTLPSAIAITLFAFSMNNLANEYLSSVVHGLKIVAIAIIAQAIWGMTKTLCPDTKRKALMALSALIVIFIPNSIGQIAAITLCGLLGIIFLKLSNETSTQDLMIQSNKKTGSVFLSLFLILLIALPTISWLYPSQTATSLWSFYKAGSLVFGGGHVVLPLLQTEVVTTGYLDNETFLAGYGAAQAVPGPLFTFASFLGAAIYDGSMGWYGSIVCLLAIFLPAFLLIAGALPFWQSIRNNLKARQVLAGANAGVVGLLVAILYDPVWTSTVQNVTDIILVITAFFALMILKWPSWLLVLVFSVTGLILPTLSIFPLH